MNIFKILLGWSETYVAKSDKFTLCNQMMFNEMQTTLVHLYYILPNTHLLHVPQNFGPSAIGDPLGLLVSYLSQDSLWLAKI